MGVTFRFVLTAEITDYIPYYVFEHILMLLSIVQSIFPDLSTDEFRHSEHKTPEDFKLENRG